MRGSGAMAIDDDDTEGTRIKLPFDEPPGTPARAEPIARDTRSTVAPGRQLDKYVLETRIGEGGMGQVWRARHATLHSKVAIKLLHGGLATSDVARRRFLSEAQLAANLKSRHAVQVFDFGVTDDGVPYLVMELLEGETLDRRIRRAGAVSPGETVEILRRAARALERAHAVGIVHRDFKPANVMLVDDTGEGGGDVKVVDFGIAKLLGELELPSGGPEIDPDHADLTGLSRTGTSIGTPAYMAPEQVKNAPDAGPAIDVWALGVVAYECLTGHRPFASTSLTALMDSILERRLQPASARNPALPAAIDAWFDRALAADPAARFAGVSLAVEELAEACGVPRAEIVAPRATPLPIAAVRAEDALAPTLLDDEALDTLHGARLTPIDLIAIIAVLAAIGGGLAFFFLMR